MTWLFRNRWSRTCPGGMCLHRRRPDFTRQHLAILEHLIQASPDVTVLNCDRGSSFWPFEKAGTRRLSCCCARRRGGRGSKSFEKRLPLSPVREAVSGRYLLGRGKGGCLDVFQAESPYLECMGAAERIRQLLAAGCRCRDITVVCRYDGVSAAGESGLSPAPYSGVSVRDEIFCKKASSPRCRWRAGRCPERIRPESVLWCYLRSPCLRTGRIPATGSRITRHHSGRFAGRSGRRAGETIPGWPQRRVDGGRPASVGGTEHGAGTGNRAADAALAGNFGTLPTCGDRFLAVWLLEDISLLMRLSRMAQELDAAGTTGPRRF